MIRRLVLWGLWAPGLLLVVAWALLPRWLPEVLPWVSQRLGGPPLTARVAAHGPGHLVLTDVHAAGLTLERLALSWTLESLRQGRLATATARGLRGPLRLPAGAGGPRPAPPALPRWPVADLTVHDVALTLALPGRSLRLRSPSDAPLLRVRPAADGSLRAEGTARLWPSADGPPLTLTLAGTVTPTAWLGHLTAEGVGARAETVVTWAAGGLRVEGRVRRERSHETLGAEGRITLPPQGPWRADGLLTARAHARPLPGGALLDGHGTWRVAAGPTHLRALATTPPHMTVTLPATTGPLLAGRWRLTLPAAPITLTRAQGGWRLALPLPLTARAGPRDLGLDGTVTLGALTLEATGLPLLQGQAAAALTTRPAQGALETLAVAGHLEASAEDLHRPPLHVAGATLALPLRFQRAAAGARLALTGVGHAALSGVRTATVQAARPVALTLQADENHPLLTLNRSWRLRGRLETPGLTLTPLDGPTLTLARTAARVDATAATGLRLVAGTGRLTVGPVTARGVRVQHVSGRPWTLTSTRLHLPPPAPPWPLRVSARGTPPFRQITATVTHGDRPALTADLRLDRRRTPARLHVVTPDLPLGPEGLSLRKSLPGAAVSGTGTVAAQGWLALAPGVPAALDVRLRETTLTLPGASVHGLTGVVRLDRLHPLRTPPGQVLAAARIQAGVPLTDVTARFALQTPRRLHLESLQARFLDHARLSLTDQTVALDTPGHQRLRLGVADLDLARLVADLPLKGLHVTGVVDGTLPVALADGHTWVRGGRLQARGPGVVRYAPDQPPGALRAAGAPVKMLMEILRDFRYHTLRMDVSGDLRGALQATVHLAGANPAFRNGHPVHFNLSLSGPLQPFLDAAGGRVALPPVVREHLDRFGRALRDRGP